MTLPIDTMQYDMIQNMTIQDKVVLKKTTTMILTTVLPNEAKFPHVSEHRFLFNGYAIWYCMIILLLCRLFTSLQIVNHSLIHFGKHHNRSNERKKIEAQSNGKRREFTCKRNDRKVRTKSINLFGFVLMSYKNSLFPHHIKLERISYLVLDRYWSN